MKVFYDFEFIEVPNGQRCDAAFTGKASDLYPISVGLVTEDGSSYYGVNKTAPWDIIFGDEWLMKHVVCHLPTLSPDGDKLIGAYPLRINQCHKDVKPYRQLCLEVIRFLSGVRDLELWADYGAYDHVLLAGMFGPMYMFPSWMPMWTHDLQHDMQHYTGIPDCWPMQDPKTEHHALEDARHSLAVYQWMHENDR